MKGKDSPITKDEFKEYITNELKISISKIETNARYLKYNHFYRSFTEFFTMFFDQSRSGFTNLSGILNAFYRKVDIKIQLDKLLFILLNIIVENENMLISEIYRIYWRHEDYPGKGLSLQSLTTILNTISKLNV